MQHEFVVQTKNLCKAFAGFQVIFFLRLTRQQTVLV